MSSVLHDDATFGAERQRLVGLAYRITGSRAEADDIVQDAWLRWQRADPATIDRPAAWLTTVTSRLSLDRLKSARNQRESYVGPWLPDAATTEPGPADCAELAESLTIGFLAVLERLGPTERVVFLLADVFALPFDEIAATVDKTPEACRQVASRARKRIREARPRYAPTDDDAWQVTAAFLAAAQAGDLEALVALLAEDAVLVADGGAEHHAARRPVVAVRIPRFLTNLAARLGPDDTITARLVNGQPGIHVARAASTPFAMAFSVADGLVTGIWIVINPTKVATLDAPPVP